jgi:hypothetical protein
MPSIGEKRWLDGSGDAVSVGVVVGRTTSTVAGGMTMLGILVGTEVGSVAVGTWLEVQEVMRKSMTNGMDFFIVLDYMSLREVSVVE